MQSSGEEWEGIGKSIKKDMKKLLKSFNADLVKGNKELVGKLNEIENKNN